MTSVTSTRVVMVSFTITGRRNLSDWDRYTAPGPGSSVPITAELNAAVRIPGAMGSPNEVDAANSAS
ncbi:MAG: hypothetical protein AUG80_20750 [Candidatus Rokubacteria bacterium 13_1_20CM_4_68_9]|nr:MAG: hypothetical protein AUG80_20750 [Candidatus Rokubacteria bacterium 13_1_20CM_4_68_9]